MPLSLVAYGEYEAGSAAAHGHYLASLAFKHYLHKYLSWRRKKRKKATKQKGSDKVAAVVEGRLKWAGPRTGFRGLSAPHRNNRDRKPIKNVKD